MKITATQAVALDLVQMAPRTGHDLRATVSANTWNRLTSGGLVKRHNGAGDREAFEITPAGVEALADWHARQDAARNGTEEAA